MNDVTDFWRSIHVPTYGNAIPNSGTTVNSTVAADPVVLQVATNEVATLQAMILTNANGANPATVTLTLDAVMFLQMDIPPSTTMVAIGFQGIDPGTLDVVGGQQIGINASGVATSEVSYALTYCRRSQGWRELPRKAPTTVIEQRVTLGTHERQALARMLKAEERARYMEGIGAVGQPLAVAGGVITAAYLGAQAYRLVGGVSDFVQGGAYDRFMSFFLGKEQYEKSKAEQAARRGDKSGFDIAVDTFLGFTTGKGILWGRDD